MTTGSFSAAHLSGLTTALAGRYRLARELGAGGMATVWLAEDLRHERRVAIKVLHPELSAVLGPERFLAEIKTTANLQHPHILPLFDSGSADGLLYYVMPYVEGETLRTRLARERQLPVADALRIASEVADALDYAHRHGVIHRDVKPENILLHDGHVVVADFGIALAVQHAGGQRMTQTGLSLGTPQYMAPEQAMGEKVVDARADIYALGAVTYEMLAGEPPFTGPTAQAIVARVMTEDPRPLTTQRRSVPPHIQAAVQTALEKLPADRFAAAREFADALRMSEPHARVSIGRSIGWHPRRVTLAVAAVAVVALVAGWTWTMMARRSRLTAAPTDRDVRPWRTTLAFPDSVSLTGPPALAPDASRLLYVARGSGGTQIWVREADSLEPRPLPGTDNAAYPAVSPDGRRVAFLSGKSLRVASLPAGPVTTVTDTLATFSLLEWDGNDHVLVSARGIVRVPVGGGDWERVTTFDTTAAEVFHTGPSPLPGSRAILFTAIPQNYADNSRFRIAVSDPATGRHRVLMSGYWARYADPGFLLVVQPDSSLVAVPFDVTRRETTGAPVTLVTGVVVEETGFPQIAVAPTGQLVYATGGGSTARRSLARVRRDGSSALVDSTWSGEARALAVSPDGVHAAAVLNLGTWDVQVRNLRTGAVSRVSVPVTVAEDPVFTRDSRSVLFVADGPEGGRLYEAALGTAASPRLIMRDPTMNFYEPALSPDGRTLYYVRNRTSRSDIYAHALDGATSPDRPLVATPASERSPNPSPDGRWLAYTSNESGRYQVYVRSTDPLRAERWQVSTGGGTTPRWSRDGRELYFFSRDSLMVADVNREGEFAVRARRALFATARFSTQPGAYDVLPGADGFLMLERRTDGFSRRQVVFVDQWAALLAAARARR